MSEANGKCDDCGRFMKLEGGASMAHQYDMVAMECAYYHLRCAHCTADLGPARSNARPASGDMSPYECVYD